MEKARDKIQNYMANNELEIERVIKDYNNYILKIIRKNNYGFCVEDIEEIASDVFLVIWNNRNKLDINKSLTPYIAGVTRKLILKKACRNKSSTINIDTFEKDLYSEDIIDLQYECMEKNSIINNALEKMKVEDRDIFIYYYYNSKGMREIAKLLNINERKVKSRLFRIRRKLKSELEKRGYSNGK